VFLEREREREREKESEELLFKVGTDTVNKMNMLSNAILNSLSPQTLGKRMNEHVEEGEYERLTWGGGGKLVETAMR
jgi:hypothetical protein